MSNIGRLEPVAIRVPSYLALHLAPSGGSLIIAAIIGFVGAAGAVLTDWT